MNSDLAPIHQPSVVSSFKRRRVQVVAVHDGRASAPLIARARTQVEELLGSTRQVMFHSWAFHHLEALDVRAMAGHLAEAAPLILLASADGALPAHVQRWLDQSLVAQEEQRAMLVALEDCEGPLCAFTVRLASRWSTDHLCTARLDTDQQRQKVIGAVEKRLRSEIIEELEMPEDAPRRSLRITKPAAASAPSPVLITEPKLREEIRMRAYHLWLHAGRPDGRELDFWLNAEREFLECQSASSAPMAEHW